MHADGIEMTRRLRRAIRKNGSRLFAQGLYSVLAFSLVGQPVLAKSNLVATANDVESFEERVNSLVPRFIDTTFCASATPVASGSTAAHWEIGFVNQNGRCTVAQLENPYFVTTLSGSKLESLARQALGFRAGGEDAVLNRFGNNIAQEVLAELRSSVTSPDTGVCGRAASGDPLLNGCTDYPQPEISCTMCAGDQPGGGSSGGVETGAPGGGAGSFSSSEQNSGSGSQTGAGGFGFRSLPVANLTGGGVYSSLLVTAIPKNRTSADSRIGTTSFELTSEFFGEGGAHYRVTTLPSDYQSGDPVPQNLGKACSSGGKQASCSSLADLQRTTTTNFIVTPSNSLAALALPAVLPLLANPAGIIIVGAGVGLLLLLPGILGGNNNQLGYALAGLCSDVSSCVVDRIRGGFFWLSVFASQVLQSIDTVRQMSDGLVRSLLYLGKFYSRCLAAIGGACGQACGPDPAAIAWCIANLTSDVPFLRGNPGVPGTGQYHSCTSVAKAIAWPFCR